jgi:site-specific recombinase XerD
MKLSQLINEYIAFKTSLGQVGRTDGYCLRAFSRAMGDEVDIQDVQPHRVNEFLAGNGPITSHWHRKYSSLISFYRYAIAHGHVPFSPLPTVLPKPPARFAPHIYTRDELRNLLEATNSYRTRRAFIEPHTFQALLLLLYGTGLRISEALSLTLGDVDLQEGVVIVRDTKFYKTRLVPIGTQVCEVMVQYAKRRKENGRSQDKRASFFVTRRSAPITVALVESSFQRLRDHAGVRRTDGARYQPRLHDLRHTFAVHRLTEGYREKQNVQKLLPQLSTYMGHAKISSTQWYLTMTPELLREANLLFAQYAFEGGVL